MHKEEPVKSKLAFYISNSSIPGLSRSREMTVHTEETQGLENIIFLEVANDSPPKPRIQPKAKAVK